MLKTKSNAAVPVHHREQELRQLNEQYVHATLVGDAAWFRTRLAEEFVCIDSDGSVHCRDAFLRRAATESDLCEYRLDFVDVRFYENVALVRASGTWTMKTGDAGTSQYIDIYVREQLGWKVVSAQITRPPR